MSPPGKLEPKGQSDVEGGAEVRSLWGLVGKSEMSRTCHAARNAGAGAAAAEAVLAAARASSFEGKRGKNGDCGEEGNSSCAKQHSDYNLKDKPL